MQFLLPPWDRNRPRAHAPMADCIVAQNGRRFGLRAQNGILFFRDENDQTKTWAIATPLLPEFERDEEGLEVFFECEFERGNIARYVVHLDSYLERTVPLFFRGDGTGWCRESWNRDDIPFTHSVSMHVLMEGADDAISEDLGGIEQQLEPKLSGLDWPDDTNWSDSEDKVEWICGSREELQKVLGWICNAESSFWKERKTHSVKLHVSSETPFSRALVSDISVGQDHHASDMLALEPDSRSDEVLMSYGFDKHPLPSRRFWALCDLAIDENTPLGTYWEYHDYGMGRCAHAPNPIWVSFSVSRPTAEQQVESLAQLRVWLRGKVPASEIEALLHDETPAEFPKKEW